MDIYERKRAANMLARDLIKEAIEQDKEVDIDKLIFQVLDEYPVPEKPLKSAIHTYIGMQEGISINGGIIRKDD